MTQIFAHRGSKGTHPENTLAAFAEACRLQTDGIELDVQLTRDKRLVVIHDETVDRTTNGTGYVKELTLEEIQTLDAGSWFDEAYHLEKIPTLEQVLALIKTKNYQGILNIELKTDVYSYPGIEEKVMAALSDNRLNHSVILSSFNLDTLIRLRPMVEERIPLAFILDKTMPFDVVTHLPKGVSLHVSKGWFKEHEGKLHQLSGYPIRIWTVNDAPDLTYYFQQKAVGVFTDFPEKAITMRKD